MAGTVETHAAVWTSGDGVAWQRIPDEGGVGGNPDERTGITRLVRSRAGILALGMELTEDEGEVVESAGVVWASVDGVTWTRGPRNLPAPADLYADYVSLRAVADSPNGLLLLGEGRYDLDIPQDGPYAGGEPILWASTDGIAWKVQDRRPWLGIFETGSTAFGSATMGIQDVVAFRGRLIAVGSRVDEGGVDAGVWTSSHGAWEAVAHDEDSLGGDGAQVMQRVLSVGDILVALGMSGTGQPCR